MRAALLVVVLVLPALTGCFGGDDGGDEPLRKARATITSSLGGVEGLVTDTAVQPVDGANVTLVELNRTTRTQSDGSYAFSEVRPGTYTVAVHAGGFVSAAETVDVVADAVATLDFLLAHLAEADPYTQAWELAGFFECGFGIGYNLSALPAPANVSAGIISWTICAEPNDAIGGNATNDRFDHFFKLDAPVETLVVETTWEPSTGTLSDTLWVDLVPEGFHCGNITTCEWSLVDHWGESPLHARVDRERFVAEQDYFIQRCENGVDAWCGYNFFDDGWPLWVRTWARWECQPAGPQACLILQQPFEHVVTAFYNAPAPEGFSVLGP